VMVEITVYMVQNPWIYSFLGASHPKKKITLIS